MSRSHHSDRELYVSDTLILQKCFFKFTARSTNGFSTLQHRHSSNINFRPLIHLSVSTSSCTYTYTSSFRQQAKMKLTRIHLHHGATRISRLFFHQLSSAFTHHPREKVSGVLSLMAAFAGRVSASANFTALGRGDYMIGMGVGGYFTVFLWFLFLLWGYG